MEKKNIGMKVAIIILSILVVGLVGYIVYDKVFIDNETNVTDENNNTNNDNIEDDNDINIDNDENNIEEDTSGLEKFIKSLWWKKDTDMFLSFYDFYFDIYREGKGCGPEHGCGNGDIDSIEKVKENRYDIKFTWDGGTSNGYDDINYLATIDISNIDNDEITLIGFYTIKGNNKTKLIDNSEKYICSGKEYDKALKDFYGIER